MFEENTQHLQLAWISNINDLPRKQRQHLEESWAGTFYPEFFCRIDEEAFAVLYADIPSRPNAVSHRRAPGTCPINTGYTDGVPVNVLAGLEPLKAGLGWSDEEMQDAFLFDVQVRYALGYHQLGEGDFDIRTMDTFRSRIAKRMQETGENLIGKAFEQIVDEQVQAYELKTGKLRMDSTQIASPNVCCAFHNSKSMWLAADKAQPMLGAVDRT